MDALNTQLIDLCCIFQAILTDLAYIIGNDGAEKEVTLGALAS